jgi:hypothetical protein
VRQHIIRSSVSKSGASSPKKILISYEVVFISFLGWGETESTSYVGHYWPTVPAPGDYDDGEFGGMK